MGEFLGITYARAERLGSPQSVPYDPSLIRARFGPAAPQPDRPIARREFGDRPEMSEADCLSLNVWTPARDTGARPVMVWLHGGGFTVGWSGAFDGDYFATTNDAVVVTLNYRLGSLGWLGGGNYGMLDVVAALSWVQTNVAAFGGDPSKVTLAGQSAGALIAADLLVSPLGDGLFTRAILQSPPMFDAVQPAERAQAWARDMGDLEGLTAEQVVDRHEQLLREPAWQGTRGGAMPTRDDVTLPDGPERDLPVLTGVNDDEGSFFPNPAVGDRIVESWERWVAGRPNTQIYRGVGTHGAEIPRVFHGDLTQTWGEFIRGAAVSQI